MSLRTDVPDDAGAEGILFNVIASTASVVGDDYFMTLPRVLASALGTTGAFVAEVAAGDNGRSVTVLGIEPLDDSVTVAIPDLATAPATRGVLAFVPRDAQRSFPADSILRQTGCNSCLAVPVHGSAGAVVGIVGILNFIDIPTTFPGESVLRLLAPRVGAEIERRRAVEEVKSKGELLRMLTDRSQDMILRYRIKPALAFEYVSPSIERVLGYTPEDLYGDPSLAFRIVHPDFRANLAKLYSGDDSIPQKAGWIRRDGETVWTEGRRTTIRDDRGEVVGYESFMRDVTAQHDAEQELARTRMREERLLDALPDTMLRVSREGVILDFRLPRTAPSLFDAPVPDTGIERFLPPHAYPLVQAALREAASTPIQTLRFAIDAAGVMHSIEARVVAGGDGDVVVFLRDVTGDEWLAHELARRGTRDALEGAAERRIARPNPYSLTFREFTVLDLVRSGVGDKELATTLGISASTASKHVSNIVSKMNAASRTEAVARAMAEGLLD